MHEHRGLSIAIALASLGFFATLAFVLVVPIWIALSVYALVKMIGSAPDSANATPVLVTVVLLVSTLVAGLAGGIALLGRPMTPRKRKDREAGEAADRVEPSER
jgi:hypothetical protein